MSKDGKLEDLKKGKAPEQVKSSFVMSNCDNRMQMLTRTNTIKPTACALTKKAVFMRSGQLNIQLWPERRISQTIYFIPI